MTSHSAVFRPYQTFTECASGASFAQSPGAVVSRTLIEPSLDYETSYREYIHELRNEERYPFPLDFDHSDFRSLVNRLTDLCEGKDLAAGQVASSTYWLVEAGEILGVSNIRHTLNDEIRRCGGHVGLGVRPSRRGRGLGTELMSLTLREARRIGIGEVHIHCYKANIASASLIKANSGVLHSEVAEADTGNVVQRFLVRPANKGPNSDVGLAGDG